MSFLKCREITEDQNGRGKIYWNRASQDGAPFRGKQIPLLKEDEFDTLTERVTDAYCQTFYLNDDKDREAYRAILDNIVAGWYQLVFRDWKWFDNEDGKPAMCVYIEWAIPFVEPTPGLANKI